MANRVTATELKVIIDTDLADAVLDVFIGAANRVVTEYLGTNATLSDDQLADIEKFLAAHLLASTREPQAQRDVADKAEVVYQGKTEMGLNYTSYGQMVQLLDTSGVVAGAVGKKQASVYAVTSFE